MMDLPAGQFAGAKDAEAVCRAVAGRVLVRSISARTAVNRT